MYVCDMLERGLAVQDLEKLIPLTRKNALSGVPVASQFDDGSSRIGDDSSQNTNDCISCPPLVTSG